MFFVCKNFKIFLTINEYKYEKIRVKIFETYVFSLL